ncbi:MAG: HD domain-containing phosphohydrolase, partial [Pirellulaceae bacterium]
MDPVFPLHHEPSSPATVLVVDDESPIRMLLCRWLGTAGYRCIQAESPSAAWSQLTSEPIDLVLCDLRMPGKSGLEMLREISDTYPHVAVIILTGQADTRLAIDALTHGASAYLIKPIESAELLLQIERALERRRLLFERERHMQRLEEKVRQQTRALRIAHEETIHCLISASMWRDEETGAHIRRVGLCGAIMAEAIGWSTTAVEYLRLAAPMHDVGKIGIPDAILRKPGTLTPEEFAIMKTHTAIGARMLAGSPSPMLQMAEEIARCHHERWDGRGYPNNLYGTAIPESARIVSIVDVFDALTHDRVYRPAIPMEKALAMMDGERGRHFEPRLLD